MALLPNSTYRYSYLFTAVLLFCAWQFFGMMQFGFSDIRELSVPVIAGYIAPFIIALAGCIKPADIRYVVLFIGLCAFFVGASPMLLMIVLSMMGMGCC